MLTHHRSPKRATSRISILRATDTYRHTSQRILHTHKKAQLGSLALSPQITRMPTAHDIKAKNARFAQNARAGKTTSRASYRERLAKKSPVGYTALTAVIFVVCGGVLFELARLFFL
ncbi:unnamed protein product [Rhizoctonia solani]|uniref:Stress-associated endoplasmic reticulum protein n=1 Tax=Rhizoctonia solani TaxID=456999 RepID=A0A8H3BNI0_9AGAM|nr:unnamed protein product [Rhizoctonia solani]